MGEWAVAFVAGLLSSLAAYTIAHIISYRINFVTARYPRFLGSWRGTYQMQGQKREELVRVEHQFRRRFRGAFFDAQTGERRSYKFSGQFITPDLVLVTFEPSTSEFADYGAAILTVDPLRNSASGVALSIDLETGKPRQMKYSLEKL